ncbi:SymE family type I addiction module toxin [Dickeya solani]|uniref:SymE family type I addiction module toxin n=1 Tax=Dickeya solani TaxID=1089444 RepID=A0ABU4EDR6_9GAMM|nr:SymE family type I addiction module toxin [Dickeya solani]MDV6995804.1 SymE family type I addiction module toxin [Dickeya solani]MDV7003763.1 SymE family type I addiction module toxin [Dickeya solani]MDV7040288.1 SymE family type I addiction module toxin [Dickeya solani]MDV7042176.1 SymE family type I addiction module toxin [Dickeya solani]
MSRRSPDLTVLSLRHDGNDKTFPVRLLTHFQSPTSLSLKGRWLEDLGFNTGQPVIVTVERGRLVIEAEIRI